jgi:hypothetical protein
MKEPKRGGRTESLSLRIDPKTKFILEFMVRITSIRITDLIEKAIKDYADKTTTSDEYPNTWLHYWHPEDGIRSLSMLMDDTLPSTYEEDEIADFVKQHKRFFFISDDIRKPMQAFIQVLWPDINHYVEHWRDHKASNRWATGELMLAAIKRADMKGPDWPIVAKPTESVIAKTIGPIDDDIPF